MAGKKGMRRTRESYLRSQIGLNKTNLVKRKEMQQREINTQIEKIEELKEEYQLFLNQQSEQK